MSRKTLSRAGIAAVLAVAAGAGCVAAVGAMSEPETDNAAVVTKGEPGKSFFSRANGVDPARAVHAFDTAAGVSVAVAEGNGKRCLVYSDGADSCKTEREVQAGWSLEVHNDCARPHGVMTITGLVSEGVQTVRLAMSDGSVREGRVVQGAFNFDGATPSEGDVSPTGVRWVDAHGSVVHVQPFPLKSTQFCPGG
jgi:hypothetical protein